MKKIVLSLLAVLLMGVFFNCSVMPDKNPSLQRQWMLVSFDGFSKDQLIDNKAEMNLTGIMVRGKIQANAYMGCNTIFFIIEFKKGGKIKISKRWSTMKACQDMSMEIAFQNKIETMTRYSVEGHFLTLSDDQGNSMKFVAADWD